MTFTIVTDSATDIEVVFKISEDIRVVPTMIIIGSEEFRDDDLEKSEFIQRLRNGEVATTSQPSPQDFLDIYSVAVEDSNSNEVLGIHISSKLSGTLSGAFSISNQIDKGTIKLFDTYNLSIGAGYFIYLACALRKNGYSLTDTITVLENVRDKVHIEVYIEKIDYLHRSGRINLGQFSLLKLFRLKPILNCIDGLLIKNGIAIGKKSGINKITKRVLRKDFGPNPVILIGHATTPEVLQQFKDKINKLTPSRIIEITICNSLMAHTGVDVIGIGIAPNIDSFINYI